MTGISAQPTTTRFKLNPLFEAQLEASEEVLADDLLAYAETVADKARGLAPVATGDYRDSLEAVVGVDAGKVTARVQANDFKAHWIEFGTFKDAPVAPIRRAVESTGKRLESTL